jgi:hypothetical protein
MFALIGDVFAEPLQPLGPGYLLSVYIEACSFARQITVPVAAP